MAVALINDIPGGSQEMYDSVMAEMHLDRPPEGAIARAAGPIEGGWRVIGIWESREHYERFWRDKLAPALEAVGAPAREGPPEFMECHDVMTLAYTPSSA
jgi:hypothetical protein